MTIDRQWLEQSLRASLETLALPGELALKRLPEGSAKADDLALEFDNFHHAFVGNFANELTATQVASLRTVDGLLDEMGGEHNKSLWTDDAVRTHVRWQTVRTAARNALHEFTWPIPAS